MKPSRQTVRDIAEGVGFVAIIASLFFVAIETREAAEQTRLKSALRPLPLNTDNGRAFWNQQKRNFVPAYRDYVDGLLADGFWN